MPELVPGYDTQQKVVTVLNDDASMNSEIETQAADQWLLSQLTPSGSDIILLFSRTVTVAP